MSVTNPGNQSNNVGHGHQPAVQLGHRLLVGGHHLLVVGNGLPPGLSINTWTGRHHRHPTTGGSYSVTITVTDSDGFTGSAGFTWTITNTVTVTQPRKPDQLVGTAITPLTVTASDSSPTATLSYGPARAAAGLSIGSSSGTISGTPTDSGVYPVTVTATDGAGFTGPANFTWTVVGPDHHRPQADQRARRGGKRVRISGSHLNGATSVMFGSVAATSFTVNGKGHQDHGHRPRRFGRHRRHRRHHAGRADHRHQRRPIHLHGTGDHPGEPGQRIDRGRGNRIRITGTGLYGATSVKFGSVAADTFKVRPKGTRLMVTVPAPRRRAPSTSS